MIFFLFCFFSYFSTLKPIQQSSYVPLITNKSLWHPQKPMNTNKLVAFIELLPLLLLLPLNCTTYINNSLRNWSQYDFFIFISFVSIILAQFQYFKTKKHTKYRHVYPIHQQTESHTRMHLNYSQRQHIHTNTPVKILQNAHQSFVYYSATIWCVRCSADYIFTLTHINHHILISNQIAFFTQIVGYVYFSRNYFKRIQS